MPEWSAHIFCLKSHRPKSEEIISNCPLPRPPKEDLTWSIRSVNQYTGFFFYNLDHVARSCTWLIYFWGHPLHPPFIFFCHLPHPVLSSSSSSSSSSSLPTQPIVQQPLKPYGEIYSWLQSKPEMVSDGEFHCTKPIWSHSAVAYGTALYATLLHYRPEGGWSHMFGFHARPCAFRLLPGRLGNILFMNSEHKRKKAERRDACLLVCCHLQPIRGVDSSHIRFGNPLHN